MSVLLAHLVLQSGRSPQNVLSRYHKYALASITAGLARECRQAIIRAPLPEEPAHAEVFGNKTYAIRKRMVEAASWVVPPSGR